MGPLKGQYLTLLLLLKKVVINSPEEFTMAAESLVEDIHTVYMTNEILVEREDTSEAQYIYGTLHVYQFVWYVNNSSIPCIQYFTLTRAGGAGCGDAESSGPLFSHLDTIFPF